MALCALRLRRRSGRAADFRHVALASVVLLGGFACGLDRSPAGPTGPTVDASPQGPFPAVTGVVRAIHGGPVAGARVRLGSVDTTSGPDGRFEFASTPTAVIEQPLTVLTTEFWIHNSIVRALAGPNPPPVNVDVALQKNYQLSLDGPLQVQLSDEDLEWGAGDPDNYHCMPCFRVGLPAAALGTHQLRVTWTGGGPLWFGLTAANANYDAVKLGEGTSSAGGSVIIADLPASWSSYWYHGVFVGLPKRGSLPDAITVELALVPATW